MATCGVYNGFKTRKKKEFASFTRQNTMSSITSSEIPLIVQTSNQNAPDYVTIINPDGSISYEPNVHYQQPTIIRRSYAKVNRQRYRYNLEQVNSIKIALFFLHILFHH